MQNKKNKKEYKNCRKKKKKVEKRKKNNWICIKCSSYSPANGSICLVAEKERESDSER